MKQSKSDRNYDETDNEDEYKNYPKLTSMSPYEREKRIYSLWK